MKVYQASEIRNFALVGSAGSGKTTLAETMLFEARVIERRGDIQSKNTVSDYHDIEHERGGSVFPTVLYAEWNDKKLNFIDAPGADDFIGGAITALNVSDIAVMVLNTQNGVEVGTEIIWRQIKRLEKPVILVMNQLDHEKSNFDSSLEDALRVFGPKTVIVQYPINPGPGFNSVVDVLRMKMYRWPDTGGEPDELEIPASEKEKAEELHNRLVEAAAENDDKLMELFFEKGELNEEEMKIGIHKGLLKHDIIPVMCTSAKRDMGARRLMQFIVNLAPAPNEIAPAVDTEGNEVACDDFKPTSLFVFKNSIEPHLGEILFFKVMSGCVEEGQDLLNVNKQAKERLSQLFVVAGKNRTKVTKLSAGDIGATVKLKETKTFHTLSIKGAEHIFPKYSYPDPRYRTAIKAMNEADEEKMADALHKISEQDPTIIMEYAKELKQLIIHGQGELHINLLKWQLDHIYKIGVEFLTPKIPYRETITKPAVASFRHKKQSGGAGQFGEVHLIIDPHHENKPEHNTFKIEGSDYVVSLRDKQEFNLDWGGKLVYYNCIVGGVIEARFMPAILKGLLEKIENGPLTGSYARDIRVFVFDGKMHPVDSNEISFKIAGSKAFSEAFKKAGPKIMEPVYDVEVIVPSDRMGDVMSDLQTRRALIQGMTSEAGYEKLQVRVPLAEMNKYSTILSSLTNGRATFSMRFAEYAQVPGDIQDKLLKDYEAHHKDEE